MTVLEQVVEMKNKGMPDSDIIQKLTEQGVPQADITDAMSRAQIKSAVSNLDENGQESTEGMEHSILGSEEEPDRLPTEGNISDEDLTPPKPGTGFGMPMVQMPARITKEIPGEDMYEPQEGFYSPQQYQVQYPGFQQDQSQQYSYYPAATDTDTMMEVAEQVFSEKNKPIQKRIDEINEFKALTQSKVDYISERLKKIESIIDSLQASILEKVEGYGDGLDSIKKEMGMMQDTFGKMVNNIADRADERKTFSQPRQQLPMQTPIKPLPQSISVPSFTGNNVLVQKTKKTTRKISRR